MANFVLASYRVGRFTDPSNVYQLNASSSFTGRRVVSAPESYFSAGIF